MKRKTTPPEPPEIPAVRMSENQPIKLIFRNGHGELFATRNFGDDTPVWRTYKRLGWAKRYIEKKKNRKKL